MLYVPILKAKKGEFDAIINLTDAVKEKIVPLFEVIPEKVSNFNCKDFQTYWPNRAFFFDFSPELDWTENYDNVLNVFDSIEHEKAIPVISLAYPDEYIKLVNKKFSTALLRIRLNELQEEDFDERLKEVSHLLDIATHQVMIDLQEVDESKITLIPLSIKTVVEAISSHFNTNDLIVAAGSFPAQLSPKKHEFYKIDRLEQKLYELIKQKLGPEVVYSDYAINSWAYSEYIPGMKISFNIRYTIKNEFLIYKGYLNTKRGFQMENVQPTCQELIKMAEYSGKDFSWGDKEIFLKATGGTDKGGSPTTWRSIGANHHITFIVDLLSNPS